MPCYHPKLAYQRTDGRVTFDPSYASPTSVISLPCGSCTYCRTKRLNDWAARCAHETSLHPRSSFITLTYRPDALPPNGSVQWSDVQKFLKRLRKSSKLPTKGKFRYYGCAEYGEKGGRPHYHLIIFGYWPKDARILPSNGPYAQASSETLTSVWQMGFVRLSPVDRPNGATVAAYVSKYMQKTLRNADDQSYLERLDDATGELLRVHPERNYMSSRPGIGASWLDQFEVDLQHGYLPAGPSHRAIPRYYMRRLERNNPELHARIKEKQEVFRKNRLPLAEKDLDRLENFHINKLKSLSK